MIKTVFFRADILGEIDIKLNRFMEEKKLAPQDIIKIDYCAIGMGSFDIMNTIMLVYNEEEKKEDGKKTDTLAKFLLSKIMELQAVNTELGEKLNGEKLASSVDTKYVMTPEGKIVEEEKENE